jgi:hypothetical protein
MVLQQSGNLFIPFRSGAEGFHLDAYRAGQADGVAEQYFASVVSGKVFAHEPGSEIE